jgi:hypothetical protein
MSSPVSTTETPHTARWNGGRAERSGIDRSAPGAADAPTRRGIRLPRKGEGQAETTAHGAGVFVGSVSDRPGRSILLLLVVSFDYGRALTLRDKPTQWYIDPKGSEKIAKGRSTIAAAIAGSSW